MNTFKSLLIQGIAVFFILLFSYAAFSKMADFENFQIQLAQSPLVSAFAGVVSYAVILIEILICILLIFPVLIRIGLYASLAMMTAFTVYIHLILNYSDFIPCSCGGILEKMGWTEHLFFNVGCMALAAVAIIIAYHITPKADFWVVTEENRIDNYWQRRKDRRVIAFKMVALLLFPSALMVALFFSSEYIMKKENNFTRRFPQHPLTEESRFQLGVNSYYFAGHDDDHIYLANTTSPFLLSVCDRGLTKKTDRFIKPPAEHLFFKSPRLQTYGAYYLLYDGQLPVIYRGKIRGTVLKKIFANEAYFNQLVITDSARFTIRTVAGQNKHFALGTLSETSSPRFVLHDDILNNRVQSLFETDGSLLKDLATGKLIYLYSYQNNFEVIDKDLRNHRTFNTIDTTSLKKLQVKILENGDKKLQTPPPRVNRKSFAYRGVLFTESTVMGRFESRKEWKEAAVIDMYSTEKQEYFGSLRIYYRGSSKLTDILVTDDHLYALMGSEIISYRLAPSVQANFQKGKAENLKESRH